MTDEELKAVVNQHTKQIATLEDKIDQIKAENTQQNTTLDAIRKDTSGLVELFQTSVGTIKFFRFLGKVLIWIGSVASAIYAVLLALSNWPKK